MNHIHQRNALLSRQDSMVLTIRRTFSRVIFTWDDVADKFCSSSVIASPVALGDKEMSSIEISFWKLHCKKTAINPFHVRDLSKLYLCLKVLLKVRFCLLPNRQMFYLGKQTFSLRRLLCYVNTFPFYGEHFSSLNFFVFSSLKRF